MEWAESPFGRSVESAGLVLSDGSGPNELSELSSMPLLHSCIGFCAVLLSVLWLLQL